MNAVYAYEDDLRYKVTETNHCDLDSTNEP